MKCPVVALCALAALIALLPPLPLAAEAAAEGPLAHGQFNIWCHDGKVTVSSNEANVEQILEEFSRITGVTFNKFVGKTVNTTLDLKGASYEDFLDRVLGSYVTKSKKVDGTVVLGSVTVMDEGPEGQPGSNPPPAPQNKPAEPGRIGSGAGDGQSREEALKRRRRRRRKPFRGNVGQDGAEAPAAPENPPPEPQPIPQEQPTREAEPSVDAPPAEVPPPPSDQPPAEMPPPPDQPSPPDQPPPDQLPGAPPPD